MYRGNHAPDMRPGPASPAAPARRPGCVVAAIVDGRRIWLPAEPLAAWAARRQLHTGKRCLRCDQVAHIHLRTAIHWLTADALACHLGVHPAVIWGDAWWLPDDPEPEALTPHGSGPELDTATGQSIVLLGGYRIDPGDERIPVGTVGRDTRGGAIAG